MTGWTDRLRVGSAPPPANAAAAVPPQAGAPTSPQFVYTAVPPAAASNQIALAQTVSGGNFALTAGSGASLVTIPAVGGQSYIDLGSARVLQYVGRSASTAAATIIVNGLEEIVLSDGSMGAGAAMSEQVTGPAGNGVVVTGKKAFRYIGPVASAVRSTGNTVSSVEIGTTDIFGSPIFVGDGGELDIFWNGASALTLSGGITLGVTTSPSTATTGDVRGTWGPPPSASNGVRRLYMYLFVRNPDTYVGTYGQFQNGVT